MLVRTAVAGDALPIAQVHVRASSAAYENQLPDDWLGSFTVERRAGFWAGELEDEDRASSLFVLADANEVRGFAYVGRSRDEDASDVVGELFVIYVLPEWWGRGGGRMLIDAALGRLRELGHIEATLWVLDSNERACRFYKAGGWSRDGATKAKPRSGLAAQEVRYRRTLASNPG